MVRAWVWALAALAMAGRCWADVAPAKNPRSDPPLSVWRNNAAAVPEHLQSGLVCPATFRGYNRTNLHIYDGFGLDVSCNYQADHSDITVYLTRRTDTDLQAAVDQAKREFLQVRTAEYHPQFVSTTHPTDGGLAWTVLLYADDYDLHDGIWLADLGGWTLEYRATYRKDIEVQAVADIDAMTAAVLASAGPRLTACAKQPPPARIGVPITDAKAAQEAAEETATLGGIYAIAAADPKIKKEPAAPTLWCAEATFPNDKLPVLFWRGVHPDGSDAQTDRVTLMTQGDPPEMTVAGDALAALAEQARPGSATWAARVVTGDMTRIYAMFKGRPAPSALAAVFVDALSGHRAPLTGYGAKGSKITIELPPK
jgi:hypothetical protein